MIFDTVELRWFLKNNAYKTNFYKINLLVLALTNALKIALIQVFS